MITDRDRKIIRHVEEYGFITINQAKDLFFREPNNGYDIARKRLKSLVNNYDLKVNNNYLTNENVYYFDKKPTYHAILLMNFYSNLISSGAEILSFEREYKWLEGKVRSDGFCSYALGDYIYYNIIEVSLTNDSSLIKYNEVYSSGEAHNLCNGVFPRIISIDDIQHKTNDILNEKIKVYTLDFKLNNFPIIFS